jgi:hypothetical protein
MSSGLYLSGRQPARLKTRYLVRKFDWTPAVHEGVTFVGDARVLAACE